MGSGVSRSATLEVLQDVQDEMRGTAFVTVAAALLLYLQCFSWYHGDVPINDYPFPTATLIHGLSV